jgi:aspartyl-tRNA(Asn)/glutamyl-tRNA(Gln) amidotransferase subunit A
VSAVNIGGFPAVNVPAARYPSGTPFGIVFVGRLWDERTLITLAHAFEAAVQGYRRAELVPQPGAARRTP